MISVRPVNNKAKKGFILTYKNNEYFYFDKESLLEGFMYHVGLEELGATDTETIQEFLAAAIVWKDQSETVKELLKLKKENETLNNMVATARKQNKILRDKLSKYDNSDIDAE